jgi:glucose/arabinose dehydrogenase
MKRFALILAGVALVGCSHNDTSSCPACDPKAAPTAQPTPAVSEAPMTPAVPATPAVAATPPAHATPAVPATLEVPATPAVPPTPPVPAAPAVAKDKPIFELAQDDKIYVFGSLAAMQSFQSGQAQPKVVEKPAFTPSGKTVVIEAADDTEAAQLTASFVKQHPAPAKP